MVPMCPNNIKSTPDKVFFAVPRDPNIRKQWCEVMRREYNVSSISRLHCCEDHFNIKEDTVNYIKYKLMKEQGEKVKLFLNKGVMPHKFQCQKRNAPAPQERMYDSKKKRLSLINESLPEPEVNSENVLERETSQTSYCDAGPSTSYIQGCENDPERPSTSVMDVSVIEPRTSHVEVSTNTENLLSDKCVQINKRPNFRSKSVQVNLTTKKTNVALSPVPLPSQNIGTSPIKPATAAVKRKLFPTKSDTTSISSISSQISHDYEPCSSSDLSYCVQDESADSDDEKHFKNVMRSSMLSAIDREPKMLLGLPKQSYHLIKLLSENIPLPTVDILITLKKLKLNESFGILALHFGYSQSTISRIFNKSLPLIASKMKDLIVWPTPTEVYKNLPISFRARYSNVISIIDCFEIQIEKPSDPVHQSLTWSQYKKCNTLKYLISCTPDGLINFISDGYGGRATDVMIVQDCGYLDCLPPKKAVMADRGFKDLSHLLGARDCTLVRPPSVSQSNPSTKDEVKQSKRIAALRIHVERVINRLREFHMLLPHACVDYNLIPVIDDAITLACGLVNIQDVLIKK
ncbi:uncharacterized protein LOC126912321 [Spodoptera frugiperda]|uniref:Uncharacterized protein LOC118271611 n=1 Tax=Spodoptera frugiperda TaxID=7108 RepID=A0A9R0D7L6_SPOFR|nr:uncharacterized protein LOC118271611 [Spodoptera frugiperda]XP_050559945.1 uncharacterized protein LOC126912321 [Spodoptera frugiperda]